VVRGAADSIPADSSGVAWFEVNHGKTVRGDFDGCTALLRGTTLNISAGSTVTPWFNVNNGSDVRGAELAVGSNGSFVWRHPLKTGDKLTVTFNIRGVVSSRVTLGR
jgi:hypothetical protein